MAIVVSAARLYPMLHYPRFLIWAVPSSVLLFSFGLEPALAALARLPSSLAHRIQRSLVPATCLAAVLLSQLAYFALPRPNELNRAAAEFIRTHAEPADLVFVHGGMHEQLLYYRRLLSWNAQDV